MSYSPENESFLTPEEERPEIAVKFGDEEYLLTWDNTTVREFTIGNDEFDNIFHLAGEEEGLMVFKQRLGSDLWQSLLDHNFPRRIYPVLDEATINVYANMQAYEIGDVPPDDL